MQLVKLLAANLGYGSKKDVDRLLRAGIATDADGLPLGSMDFPGVGKVRISGEKLDPLAPLVLVMHKPPGYTCSTTDPGKTTYELLPHRFSKRNPGLNPVGGLDKETSGIKAAPKKGSDTILIDDWVQSKN